MASATRQKFDNKAVTRVTPVTAEVRLSYLEDGVVKEHSTLTKGIETKPVTTYVPVPDRITLSLSLEEAATLRLIVYTACAGSIRSRRQDTDAIDRALLDAGVRAADETIRDSTGSRVTLYFRDDVYPMPGALSSIGGGASPNPVDYAAKQRKEAQAAQDAMRRVSPSTWVDPTRSGMFDRERW